MMSGHLPDISSPRSLTSSSVWSGIYPAQKAIKPDSRLLQPRKQGAFCLDPALASSVAIEDEARRSFVERERTASRQGSYGAKLLLKANRRNAAVQKKLDFLVYSGRDLKAKLQDVEPASDEDVDRFSVKLNLAMCALYPEQRSQTSYFVLFRHMDEDNSGLVSWFEVRTDQIWVGSPGRRRGLISGTRRECMVDACCRDGNSG